MERRRKRPRPQWTIKSTVLIVGGLLATGSVAFTPVQHRNIHSSSSAVVLWQTAIADESRLVNHQAAVGESTSLPPWLDRYRHMSFTEEQVEHEVGWLEYVLLEQGFAVEDIRTIVSTLYCVVDGDWELALGCVDFLRLFLTLLDEPYVDGLVTKEVLLASVLHYTDCVVARRQGLREVVSDVLYRRAPRHFLSPWVPEERSPSTLRRPPEAPVSKTVQAIADGAARIKRAEILVDAVNDSQTHYSEKEAASMRGLLLSVTDDWRSLAIRCVACLYRLEGIVQVFDKGATAFFERTPEMVRTARAAMRVYAILAQRLGMHRLKGRIEQRAFRILYKRQYRAVSSLYRQNGEAMRNLSHYLLDQISRTLRRDDALMAQVEDLQVFSRVKEPYSFWKKLLKKTKYGPPELAEGNGGEVRSSTDSSSLTVTDVQDGIALRIILRARPWTENEPPETTRARERLLCYYVQHLIRKEWPEVAPNRLKDYIRFPKPNGYQSLHHTSSIVSNGLQFPFEVQIRSEEMHRIAEFGVAAHWDYKLGSTTAPYMEAAELPPGFVALLPPSKDASLKAGKRRSWFPGAGAAPIERARPAPVGAGSYLDALATAKEGLRKNEVYVFVAGSKAGADHGQLISLSPDARVRDAVDAMGSLNDSVASGKAPLWRNGRPALLDDQMENGDVILIG